MTNKEKIRIFKAILKRHKGVLKEESTRVYIDLDYIYKKLGLNLHTFRVAYSAINEDNEHLIMREIPTKEGNERVAVNIFRLKTIYDELKEWRFDKRLHHWYSRIAILASILALGISVYNAFFKDSIKYKEVNARINKIEQRLDSKPHVKPFL